VAVFSLRSVFSGIEISETHSLHGYSLCLSSQVGIAAKNLARSHIDCELGFSVY
jgi:hypothetical protein